MSAEIDRATEIQRRAADPAASAWVSANAGSGKTRVLTERVARLLLAGVRPERVLCLTYTKAAAAEMGDRLAKTLGRWALLDDAPLAEQLFDLGGERVAPARLAAARRLFAGALETPGGLRIETIHAFCEAALRRFPVEAQVPPGFGVVDDALAEELALRARDALAEAAARGEDDAFDRVAAHLVEESLDGLIHEILSKRALFAGPLHADAIAAAFGVEPEAMEAAEAEAPLAAFDGLCAGDDLATLRRAAEVMAAEGGKSDATFAQTLAAALAETEPTRADALIRDCFLTKDGAPRSYGRIPTKKLHEADPTLRETFERVCGRLDDLCERGRALAAARRALDLGRFGRALLAAYDREKRRRGALDFDDLIETAGRLLGARGGSGDGPGDGSAEWARYKLDRGFDHILLDEAQDTAPPQWEALKALLAPLHEAGGAAEGRRSLFVVGDEKQSIYSFQGAEPARFSEERDGIGGSLAASGAAFRPMELETSFRSAPVILQVVDRSFEAAAEGLSAEGRPPRHSAAKQDRPGRVDLWPLVAKTEGEAEPDWWEPIDATPPEAPKPRLARALGAEIARLIREETLPGGGRRVRPGDVMVLVRKRDVLAAELIRTLKRAGVPVAGADRVRLAEELAVRDLLALARFALTPEDDLTLAALLKSPLCGLTEDELFDLAHGREGRLWPEVRRARDRFPEAVAFLDRARGRADFLRPYEFLDRALTGEGEAALRGAGGRARLLARLGAEAEDAIDELLAQALAYETAEAAPTLEGFLDRMERSDVVIKREMEKAADGAGAVRVMTVHGAKGLEAPVVILPDALPTRPRPGVIVKLGDRPGLPAWSVAERDRPRALAGAVEAAKQRELEESRRLLYVAMTRAERWLIVAGAGDPPKSGESWHGLVESAMRALGAEARPAPEGLEGEALRVENAGSEIAPEEAAAAFEPPPEPPGWTRRRPAPPPPEPLRHAASALGDPATAPADPAGDSGDAPRAAETARARGTAIHALFETLPALPRPERESRGRALLRALWPEADEPAREQALGEALACLALPEAAPLFAPDALAEVPVVLTLGEACVSGRIDRLRVEPDRVLAVDFKSDAAPPPEGAAPEPYLRQLAAYRLALTRLYPGRRVELALLWTALPRFERMADPALEAALARLRSLDPARTPS